MPGGWMIGLGKGMQDATGAVDLWAKMRESGDRTALEQRRIEDEAAYRQSQVDQAKRNQRFEELKFRIAQSPGGRAISPEGVKEYEEFGMQQFMTPEKTLGGMGLNLPTGLPGGPGGPPIRMPNLPMFDEEGTKTGTRTGVSFTPPPTGMSQGPMVGTPNVPAPEETGGWLTAETEDARARSAQYAADARERAARERAALDERRRYDNMILGRGRLDLGERDSLRDFMAFQARTQAQAAAAANRANLNNYANQNYLNAYAKAQDNLKNDFSMIGRPASEQSAWLDRETQRIMRGLAQIAPQRTGASTEEAVSYLPSGADTVAGIDAANNPATTGDSSVAAATAWLQANGAPVTKANINAWIARNSR